MKKVSIIASLAMSALILTGCGGKDEQPKPKPKEEAQEEVVEQKITAPFTGMEVAEEVTQRPILVTINNDPKARPQSGLASADMVFEMLTEGQITRFVALFQSKLPENVGPVRSARPYFINLAKGLDAFYVAHGYSEEAKAMLQQGFVDNINGMNYDGTLFKRSNDRVAPHNSYISKDSLLEAGREVNANMEFFGSGIYDFYTDGDKVTDGMAVHQVDVDYDGGTNFYNTYAYDAESKTYQRQSGGVTTVDALTSETVTLANILVLEMYHQVIDNEGRRSIDLNSGGNARLYQQGIMRELQWQNKQGVPVVVEADGKPVKLVPGKTWVNFVPNSPGMAQSVKNHQ